MQSLPALPASQRALRMKQGQEGTDGGTRVWGHGGDVAKARQNPWQGHGLGEISRALISCNFFSLREEELPGLLARLFHYSFVNCSHLDEVPIFSSVSE